MDFLPKCEGHNRFDPKVTRTAPPMGHSRSKASVLDVKRMPLTGKANEWIMVVVDFFSKYVITGALKDKTAESVVNAVTDL